LWRTYAVDPRARINLGIRRRLAALMDNDRRKIELMNALLLSMRARRSSTMATRSAWATTTILAIATAFGRRCNGRSTENAGFSRADPQRLYLPVLMDPLYGYQAVNVESQEKDPSSLLNWMRRMITIRRTKRRSAAATLTFLYPRNRRILAFLREHGS